MHLRYLNDLLIIQVEHSFRKLRECSLCQPKLFLSFQIRVEGCAMKRPDSLHISKFTSKNSNWWYAEKPMLAVFDAPLLMLFQIDDEIAARLVSIMDDFSVNAAASMLPSSVIRQHPSTPSFKTDLSTSGSLLAANINAQPIKFCSRS